ncbi:MAG TPA: amino acid-binding protein [Verrucomicrobiae bacterium]|jgi:hypothetical protein|nr:amino acid-binding protein [Verrucomicrobiae bacterium]
MAYSVNKVDVWVAEIDDRPGGLADKLEGLTQAGATFEFVISRRSPENPGKGVVFLTPIKGAKQTRAANDAGFNTTSRVHSVRVSGPDRQGLGVKMTRALADAGINLRGVSGAAIGRQSVAYFGFDSAEDATNAMKILKKTLK